jgi:hypothetical protein
VNFSTVASQVPEITKVLHRTARDCTFVGPSMLVHVLPIGQLAYFMPLKMNVLERRVLLEPLSLRTPLILTPFLFRDILLY